MRISFVMPPRKEDVFTQEAATSLVGQCPKINGISMLGRDYACTGQITDALLLPTGILWITAEINEETT
jgi:hypothetical protein